MTLRAEFPIFDEGSLHYLDNAATPQVPRPVLEAMWTFDARKRANVSRGVHRLAEAADSAYLAARETAARFLGADPAEIVFTSGTTAALNLLAHGLTAPLAPGDEIIVTALEHHSNLVPWQMAAERRGVALRVLPITAEGRLDLSRLDAAIGPRCRVLAVTQCSNVTGALTPLAPLVAAARAAGATVVVDGAQGSSLGPFDLPALGIDFYAFSGHKCFGPTGIGILWGRREKLAALPPLHGGGGMVGRVGQQRAEWADPPRRFEAGTPPITQAVGLAAALDWLSALDRPWREDRERRLLTRLFSGLASIPRLRLIGPAGLEDRKGIVSVTIDGAHPHDICQILDDFAVACRGGHHCAQPLMEALGVPGTVRASLAPYNDEDDIDALLEGLAAAAHKLTR